MLCAAAAEAAEGPCLTTSSFKRGAKRAHHLLGRWCSCHGRHGSCRTHRAPSSEHDHAQQLRHVRRRTDDVDHQTRMIPVSQRCCRHVSRRLSSRRLSSFSVVNGPVNSKNTTGGMQNACYEAGKLKRTRPRNKLCDGPHVLYCTDRPFSSLVPHGRDSQ